MIAYLRSYVKRLSQREQRVLISGAALTMVLISYSLIYLPLEHRLNRLNQAIQRQSRSLQWLRAAEKQLDKLPKVSKRQPFDDDQMTIVERSLRVADLSVYLQRIAQPKPDRLNLVLNDAPFDYVMDWWQNFSRHYAVKLVDFTAKKQKKSGMVTVELTLGVYKSHL